VTYVKTEWVDESPPDIDALHLNKIEQGIFDAHAGFAAAQTSADHAQSDATSAIAIANGAVGSVSTVSGTIASHVANVSNPHAVTSKQVGSRHLKNAVKRGAKALPGFDNTAILQTLLDEIKAEGGGELYIPGDSGAVYETKNLWVQGSNTRIVSEGAYLKFTGQSPYARGTSFACIDFTKADAAVAPSGFIMEGLTVWCAYDIVTETIVGIALNCDHALVRDCTVIGIPKDAVYVGGYQGGRSTMFSQDVRIERCELLAARRNVLSVTGAEGCWIDKCRLSNSTASDPGSPGSTNPGAGIDLEPNYHTTPMQDIWITDCVIENNGGAGVLLTPSGASDNLAIDVFRDIYVRGNTIRSNGVVGSASSHGGVSVFQYGETAGEGSVLIQGNSIQFNTGYGVFANSPQLTVRVLDNDLRHNSLGTLSGGAHGGSIGFSWDGSSNYDDGRNLRSN
jgi:hypothetical protein